MPVRFVVSGWNVCGELDRENGPVAPAQTGRWLNLPEHQMTPFDDKLQLPPVVFVIFVTVQPGGGSQLKRSMEPTPLVLCTSST